tara:strand:+ start:37821 stop:38432 length:612 start_codon:yes stop_codon:yes gene_type:complete
MDRSGEDGSDSPRIDIKALPDSVAHLWDTMLRLDPKWDFSVWLDNRAKEELELVESHLGREKLRLEQRMHRIETLVKRLKRQREVSGQNSIKDPNQKNLFDVFGSDENKSLEDNGQVESDEPAVSLGIMDNDDDPLLAIVAEHILRTIEVADLESSSAVHFDEIVKNLNSIGITVDEIDEAIAFLLSRRAIIEIEQDFFGLDN